MVKKRGVKKGRRGVRIRVQKRGVKKGRRGSKDPKHWLP